MRAREDFVEVGLGGNLAIVSSCSCRCNEWARPEAVCHVPPMRSFARRYSP